MRLTQEPGLDKSLASRLVQAVRTQSSHDFLHTVPSPGGPRILIQHAQGLADTSLLRDLEAAVMRFESLLDALPADARPRRADGRGVQRHPRAPRADRAPGLVQAQSFLFGHFCETLTTSLFVMPAAEPGGST